MEQTADRRADAAPAASQASPRELLRVGNLRTTFHSHRQLVQAVRGVDLAVYDGDFLAVVGESGSGKSVTMKSVMDLLPSNADVEADELVFDGQRPARDGARTNAARCAASEIAMIFQDPMTSLDPLHDDRLRTCARFSSAIAVSPARRPTRRPCACSARSASPRRRCASSSTRTSSRAACAKGSSSPWRCAASRACSSPTSPPRRST